MSSPHRGRDLPRRALGKTDPDGRWLRAQLERPGVLLLHRLGPGGPRGVAVAMFGHTGLCMLICRCERVKPIHIMHQVEYSLRLFDVIGDQYVAFPVFLV